MRAGIDRREQRKALAEVEKALQHRAREATGAEATTEDKARDDARALRADKYDGYDMVVQTHWSEKSREDMSERDWRIFREDFNISYRGGNPTLPIRSWKEGRFPDVVMQVQHMLVQRALACFPAAMLAFQQRCVVSITATLSPSLLRCLHHCLASPQAIERHGYVKPSPIQMAAIPLGMQQRDVIGIAETGSGKTAAFVIPMLCYIMKQPVMKGRSVREECHHPVCEGMPSPTHPSRQPRHRVGGSLCMCTSPHPRTRPAD